MMMGDNYSMGEYSEDGWMTTDSNAYNAGPMMQDGTIIESGQGHSAHCPHCEQQRQLQMQQSGPSSTPMDSAPPQSFAPQYAPMPTTAPMGTTPMGTLKPMPAVTPEPAAEKSEPPTIPEATEAFMAPTEYYNPPPHLPSPISPAAGQQPTLRPVKQGLAAPIHY